ncbi:hypothetical protein SAMN04487926_15733 [Paraburkholderia steynii]|uniref:Uncharacterized protein n=1 Tax=Paraburkholderia steynii TaxID=1245441 RepID=A0A7Z7FP71_9BURK|nr:hypothetical protein SAMN04487926_15733 [Paraburkholderia steynii]
MPQPVQYDRVAVMYNHASNGLARSADHVINRTTVRNHPLPPRRVGCRAYLARTAGFIRVQTLTRDCPLATNTLWLLQYAPPLLPSL